MHIRVHTRVVCNVAYTVTAKSIKEAKKQLEHLELEGIFSGPAVAGEPEVVGVLIADTEITDAFEY